MEIVHHRGYLMMQKKEEKNVGRKQISESKEWG